MSCVISRLLLIGGVLSLSFMSAPPPNQEDRLIIATATGFVDTEAAEEREKNILAPLKVQAELMPDSFADVAAACFNAASERAYALGTMHELAVELGPDNPGIGRSMNLAVCDVRMLLQAHLLFKQLAENEERARLALGFAAQELAA